MFTDLCCEDWDSTKNQDDFIKSYFNTKEVNLAIASCLSKSKNKSRIMNTSKESSSKTDKLDNEDNVIDSHILQNKRSLNCQLESKKKRKKRKKQLLDSSQEHDSEIEPQLQDNQMTGSSNYESNHVKKKKKKMIKSNISNEFLKQTIASNDNTHLQKNETDSSCLKLKKKRMRNEINCMYESHTSGTESLNNAVSTETTTADILSEDDSSQKLLKKKKKKLKNKLKAAEKLSETGNYHDGVEFNSFEDGHILSFDRNESSELTSNTAYDNSSEINNNLSSNISNKNSLKKKKKKQKKLEKPLECNEFLDDADAEQTSLAVASNKAYLLQNKAYQKLQAAKFRYLNEMLYTNSGKEALSYFQQNTDEFMDYHQGYQSQVSKWPINPVDIIIQEISQINKHAVIADLGCGEAKIAEVFPKRTVHSFDLIALKNCVIACDMAKVPLPSQAVDVVVFCLSLMGTNWKDYLKEGHRILKHGGIMKIAEIESRIENVHHFIKEIEASGFSLLNQNLSHKLFVFLNFKKVNKSKKPSKVPAVTLKPCLYKKR